MHITVEREKAGGNRREVWSFYASFGHGQTLELRLDQWLPEARPTRRHKWKRNGEAYKHRTHNSHVHHGGFMRPAADVPMPEDVVQEARETLLGRLTIIGPVDPPATRRTPS